jgi:hypothetical protein
MVNLDVPNLDAMTAEELFELGSELHRLAGYADSKALAMRYRLAGKIELAQRQERRCEAIYNTLPPSWRW